MGEEENNMANTISLRQLGHLIFEKQQSQDRLTLDECLDLASLVKCWNYYPVRFMPERTTKLLSYQGLVSNLGILVSCDTTVHPCDYYLDVYYGLSNLGSYGQKYAEERTDDTDQRIVDLWLSIDPGLEAQKKDLEVSSRGILLARSLIRKQKPRRKR